MYQDDAFLARVLNTIEEHDASKPLFLFWAPVRGEMGGDGREMRAMGVSSLRAEHLGL